MREQPRMIAAWSVADEPPFTTKDAAYMMLAQHLLARKYPSWMFDDGWLLDALTLWFDPAVHSGWLRGFERETVVARITKGRRLGVYSARIVEFVARLAKFLEYVDRRRSILSKMAHLAEEDLDGRLQYAESMAEQFMVAAEAYRSELHRRIALKSLPGDHA